MCSLYMSWHDYAGTKLNYLFESQNKIGLGKRFDAQLRLCINTETVTRVTVNVAATAPYASNTGYS